MAACILTYPYMTSDFKDGGRFNHGPSANRKRIHSTDPRPSPSTPSSHSTSSSNEILSWHRFYEHCGPPAWKYNNRIGTQLKCSHLEGLAVAWEGEVTQVQISNVRNLPAYYIHNYLPDWLAQLIRCFFAEKKSGKNDDITTEECLLSPNYLNEYKDLKSPSSSTSSSSSSSTTREEKSNRKCCSLNKWNTYEYEINVRMASKSLLSKGIEIVLQASHRFGNFTERLAQGDRIHFYGFLMNGGGIQNGHPVNGVFHSGVGGNRHEQIYKNKKYILGGERAMIKLAAIECIKCLDTKVEPVILENLFISVIDARIRDLKRGIKFLLNVLLNPLITFK